MLIIHWVVSGRCMESNAIILLNVIVINEHSFALLAADK